MSDTETLPEKQDKQQDKQQDKIPCKKQNNDTDFPMIGVEIIKRINFKVAIFLFLFGILVFSDIFIENVLPKSMTDGLCAGSEGTIAQLTVFILFYLILDLLVQGGLV